MSYQNINAMNQQSLDQEHARFNPTNPDHTDSFFAKIEQRKYLHEAISLEQRPLWNSSSSSCCQPSKHHSRHGEPLYRSLLKPHHCSQPSLMEYVEGVHHRHHKQCLFETENTAAGNCFSSQCLHYNPCRCGSPMLHESNTRLGSISKGQSYYPNRALPNEITLYNWYLIRSGDSHSFDIAVGGFLSSRVTEVERIETTTIVKRLEECKLLTKDGDVINLVGPIDDYRTVSNGFTLQTVHLFISGFPHIWNLLVGMGLPARAAGTITSSQSCDFHGGQVTFQERLHKEVWGQRGDMQHSSAFEGLGTDLVSYPEEERNCLATQGTEGSPVVDANKNTLESAFLREQDNGMLNGECQSKEEPPLLHDQVQEKGGDEEAAIEGNCAEGSQHEASHVQRSTASELAEATDLACQLDNMPIESVEAAVSEIAFGNKEHEVATENNFENGAKEKNHANNQAFVEATADAGAESDKLCGENLPVAYQMSEGELGMAKSSKIFCKSSPEKRKVAFSTANDVEGGDPSCASLTLETSPKCMQKSCSLVGQEEDEFISSVIIFEKQKGVLAKKATAKKKGKYKRRGRVSLARSKRSSKPTLAEATDQACEPDNMAIESVEAAVSEIAPGNKDSEAARENNIESGTKEKDHANQVFVQATANAGAEADNISGENHDLASVQSFQLSEGELGMAKSSKSSCKSSPKKRKVAFISANIVEGGDPSCASLSLDTSTKSMEKSCGLFDEKEEKPFSSFISIEKRKDIVAKKATAKKKGKHKRRGRVLLARSKRSTKPTVQVEFKRKAGAIKQSMDSSNVEEPDTGPNKRKSRRLKEGQVIVVAEQDIQRDKSAEQVSGPSLVIRTRQGSMQKFNDKKRVQTTLIAKEGNCIAKSKDLVTQTALKNVAQMEGDDLLLSRSSLKNEKRRRSRGPDVGLQLDTSEQKEAEKSLEKFETLEVEGSSCAPEISKQSCIGQIHDGNGPSSMTSARKRMKQMLPPPLPSPLMSVSKQLVSKAFGLKTSKSGRLLVPPLAHWRGQSLVRDMDGGIIAIEDGSQGTLLETGCFNFKPPIEARAKKLQEWLSVTASKCLTNRVNARRKGSQPKTAPK